MGGKIWSEAEEKYFWRTAVSWSPKRAGIDTTKPERSWDQLAIDMQASMGDAARRQYSGGLLFDHWNQNVNSQRRSPNAGIYLQEYKTKRNQGNQQSGHRRNNSSATSRPELSPRSLQSLQSRTKFNPYSDGQYYEVQGAEGGTKTSNKHRSSGKMYMPNKCEEYPYSTIEIYR
ncbi:hypothetical protein F5X97DRAFT_329785 [Nemania serpens]|nr:hypothetical protein F5X97DRAFT_329785 [Nemania serpens]